MNSFPSPTDDSNFQHILDQFSIILVRPRSAGNIGATARALKNMGISDLRLVAPQTAIGSAATARAVHGRDLLARAAVYPDLESALAGITLSVGTTCRAGRHRGELKEIREVARELVQKAASNRIGIIFGPENYGLLNSDLPYCQLLTVIPTSPAYPSLNLAQAVMVVAYELLMSARSCHGAASVQPNRPSQRSHAPALTVEVTHMLERMKRALIAIGFLSEQNPAPVLAALRALFGRAQLNNRELAILNGIAHQISWYADGGSRVIENKLRRGQRIR